MLPVSYEYKNSMKAPLRGRGYIKADIKLVNDDFQNHSNVEVMEDLLIAAPLSILNFNRKHVEYATFEENFIKVDGKSTKFMKQDMSTVNNENVGIITKTVKSNRFTTTIKIKTLLTPQTFKGLTLDFGDNYATNFEIITDTGEIINVNNDSNIWSCTNEFVNVSEIQIVIKQLKYNNNRARLYGVLFGLDIEFNNNNVIRATLNDYISPISAEIPQSDFSITVDNHDGVFDFENPDSPINMMIDNIPMSIQYGYEVSDNNIEWLKPFKLYCDEWGCDNSTAYFKCVDDFRKLDDMYDRGLSGTSCLTVAENIMNFIGYDKSKYEFDTALGDVRIFYPFPKVSCREALQLIANATQCTLSLSRDGKIIIKRTVKASMGYQINTSESIYESDYSSVIEPDKPSAEYAMFFKDYITVDGKMKFVTSGKKSMVGSGFVSSEVSDNNGDMSTNYNYIIKLQPKHKYNHIRMIFAQNAYPKKLQVKIMDYSNGAYRSRKIYNVSNSRTNTVSDFYMDVYTSQTDAYENIGVNMIGTAIPNSRLILKKVIVDDAYSLNMEKTDMLTYPLLNCESRIGKIEIPYHTYTLNTNADSIFNENIVIENNVALNLKFDEPHKNYQIKVDDVVGGNVMNVFESPYDVDITFLAGFSGEHKIEVLAKGYVINESIETIVVNKGSHKAMKWDNPLVATAPQARLLGNWLADYYNQNSSYSYDTRGNPELEVGDVIYQENTRVQVYEQTLEFSQGFKGKIKTHRLGG